MGIGKKIKSLFEGHSADLLCYAPLNNMLIDQQGNVRICCHNSNDFTIGKFPEQNLHDIWFGEVRQNMVAEMRAGRIPPPCIECVKNGINDQSPDSKINSSKTYGRGAAESYPQQIELLLDNECNLSCIMCASNKSSTLTVPGFIESPITFGEDFLKQMQPFFDKVRFTVFSGGEPFLIPVYRDIWDYLYLHNPSAGIYVQTNGTVLNSAVKALLNDYSFQLGVSVDALTPEIYERIRIRGKFAVMFENLKYFQQYSATQGNHMTLMMTPMTLNAAEVPKLLEYCNDHELVLSLSILNWPYHLAIWALPAEQIFALLQSYQLLLKTKEPGSPLVERNQKVFAHFVKLIEEYYNTRKTAELNQKQLKEQLIQHARIQKKAFIKQLAETSVEVDAGKKPFSDWMTQYIDELQVSFTDKLVCDEFVYYIFRGKELGYFVDLYKKENPDNLLIMGKKRLKELLFLATHNCFERLGVEILTPSES